jgi:putative phage-type endonuclease
VLKQGTPEWLAWRRQGIGASDVPIILGVSPWRTPLQLWEDKTGRREPQPWNPAMRRGAEMESKARAAYESLTGNMMQPAERTHPLLHWLRASLDGITLDGALILEVKCPGREAHASALAGQVPDYYIPQVQAQLFVSAAERCHYWSFDGREGVLIEVLPDVAMQERIVRECQVFWQCVQSDTPPTAVLKDERTDAAWRDAAQKYIHAKAEAEAYAKLADHYKATLAELAPQGASGAGVMLVKCEREGAIRYAEAIKTMLPDVDLSPWRGKPSTYYCIKEQK